MKSGLLPEFSGGSIRKLPDERNWSASGMLLLLLLLRVSVLLLLRVSALLLLRVSVEVFRQVGQFCLTLIHERTSIEMYGSFR